MDDKGNTTRFLNETELAIDWDFQTPRIQMGTAGWVKGQTITNTGKFYRYIY